MDECRIDLPDANIFYWSNFLTKQVCDTLFETLLFETPWRNDPITVFGRTFPQPRLTVLYGEQGLSYSYSGIIMNPRPFTPVLLDLKDRVEQQTSSNYTSILLNLYRDGRDSNGWHADDEKELGQNPIIASLSLGSGRRFLFRHKKEKSWRHEIYLEPGSLLLMAGATQHYWQHQIPKTKKAIGMRINLTFRKIINKNS